MPIETNARGWKRLVWKVAAVAIVLAVYGGAVTIADLRANRALSCINDSLGERGSQGQAYDGAVSDAFEVIYLSGKEQITKPEAQARFLHDAAVVNRIAAYRKAHPLGRC
jgi:hypothetical protein